MELLLPAFLGVLALVYIGAPLWAGVTQSARKSKVEGWHSVEQLELDRELGKIDDAEYEELKPRAPAPMPSRLPSLEGLILGARRQKRVDVAVETEVLIARARRKK